MAIGSYEIKKAKNGQFYFNLKASNGEIILSSEMYVQKASAQNGITSVQKNCIDETKYEKSTSKNGKFYFNLKAANHQIIGTSEMYESESSCKNGIASVMKNGVTENIKDLTV